MHTNKHSHTLKWSLFSVGRLFLEMGPSLDTPRDTPLKKTDPLFPNLYQLPIASWSGMGLCVHFPFSVSGFVRFESGCAIKSLWVLLCTSPTGSRRCFLWRHPPPLAPTTFLPSLLHGSLALERRGLTKTSHLRLGAPKSLISCTLSSYGSQLIPSTTGRNFSDENWLRHWSISKTGCH